MSKTAMLDRYQKAKLAKAIDSVELLLSVLEFENKDNPNTNRTRLIRKAEEFILSAHKYITGHDAILVQIGNSLTPRIIQR